MEKKPDVWIEEEVWRMEMYISFGIIALGLLSLLAITSLPSIANSLNWREFSFVQVKSTLAYSGGFSHRLQKGGKGIACCFPPPHLSPPSLPSPGIWDQQIPSDPRFGGCC